MNKKYILYLLVIFIPLIGEAQVEARVIETAHIADVLPYVDETTWVLVDLDNTMFQAKQALGHADWFYDVMQRGIESGMTREEAMVASDVEWMKIQKICPVKPMEGNFIPMLLNLQARGVVVMGLTARQVPVVDATLDQIASLEFDYVKTAPSKETFAIQAQYPTLYRQGVLFTGCNKKGDVFLPFLAIVNKKPKKILFIDDKKKNVVDLEQALSQYKLDYIGVHYTAIEKAPRVYSRELAEYQYQCVGKILSNEAATLLMQHGH